MKKTIYTTSGSQETQDLGEKVALSLKKGTVLALYGELGAGKTTFVQGLAKGLGVTKRIISPTFIIVRTYKFKRHLSISHKTRKFGIRSFYHIDLYRIQGKSDIKGLGIEEIINDPHNIVAVEWAEKMDMFLPKKRIDIHFNYLQGNKRQILLKLANL